MRAGGGGRAFNRDRGERPAATNKRSRVFLRIVRLRRAVSWPPAGALNTKVTTMVDELDALDEMLKPESPAIDAEKTNVLAIGVRAKSSEEIEAREREYHTTTEPGQEVNGRSRFSSPRMTSCLRR